MYCVKIFRLNLRLIQYLYYLTLKSYCRNLRFDEKPDYTYLRKLLKDLFIKSDYKLDYIYDWNIINEEKKQKEKEDEESKLLK